MARNATLARGGFTLIEILMVMALAAILLGIAIPSVQDRDVCGAMARVLVADASRARSYSARIWEPVTLDVDTDNGAWRVVRQDGTWVDGPGADENGWRTLDKTASFEAVNGVATDTIFLPNGRASENSKVRIRSGSDSWILDVQGLTGRVTASPEN